MKHAIQISTIIVILLTHVPLECGIFSWPSSKKTSNQQSSWIAATSLLGITGSLIACTALTLGMIRFFSWRKELNQKQQLATITSETQQKTRAYVNRLEEVQHYSTDIISRSLIDIFTRFSMHETNFLEVGHLINIAKKDPDNIIQQPSSEYFLDNLCDSVPTLPRILEWQSIKIFLLEKQVPSAEILILETILNKICPLTEKNTGPEIELKIASASVYHRVISMDLSETDRTYKIISDNIEVLAQNYKKLGTEISTPRDLSNPFNPHRIHLLFKYRIRRNPNQSEAYTQYKNSLTYNDEQQEGLLESYKAMNEMLQLIPNIPQQ